MCAIDKVKSIMTIHVLLGNYGFSQSSVYVYRCFHLCNIFYKRVNMSFFISLYAHANMCLLKDNVNDFSKYNRKARKSGTKTYKLFHLMFKDSI